eukprot:gene11245-23518_t
MHQQNIDIEAGKSSYVNSYFYRNRKIPLTDNQPVRNVLHPEESKVIPQNQPMTDPPRQSSVTFDTVDPKNIPFTSSYFYKTRKVNTELTDDEPIINAIHEKEPKLTNDTYTSPSKVSRRSSFSLNDYLSNSPHTNLASFATSKSFKESSFPYQTKSHDFSKLSEIVQYNEHLMSVKVLAETYQTNVDLKDISKSIGLTNEQATNLLHKYGKNLLSQEDSIPLWILFILQFTNLFNILLILAGFLSLIAYFIPPVLGTSIQTCHQEAKSKHLMKKFMSTIPDPVKVIRDKTLLSVDAADIVQGDLIVLTYGDRIPSDCRIIDNLDLQVDQSILTGESEIMQCSVEARKNDPIEAGNMIFKGSLVLSGSCYAISIRTGDNTLIGNITHISAKDLKNNNKRNSNMTALKSDVEDVVRKISKFSLFCALLVFIVGVSRGLPVLRTFIRGFVVVIVANIPHGLPSTVVSSLLVVAERMQKQNVFVKKLEVVETLGSCTLICTDKTGTLTQNIMTVSHIWLVGGLMTA